MHGPMNVKFVAEGLDVVASGWIPVAFTNISNVAVWRYDSTYDFTVKDWSITAYAV